MIPDGFVQTLLDKQIINFGATQVLAKYKKIDYSLRGLDLQNIFIVEDVQQNINGKFLFKLSRLDDKEPVIVSSDNILLVDGMEPAVLAKAFEINIDGSKKILGKRRGRPRKHFPYGVDA